jgi:acetaldehyde dehydrogenase
MTTNVAILGSGNIGLDLLYKTLKSNKLNLVLFVGRSENSKGIAIAKSLGITTSIESIDGIKHYLNDIDLIFDATNAESHRSSQHIFEQYGKLVVDLTPSRVGEPCIPIINLKESLSKKNISLVTCGGQASIPLLYEISNVTRGIKYIELAATISSDSAGMGTRENIDEYTVTTEKAIESFTGVENIKSILSLNPAIPQITMRNTVYIEVDNYDKELLTSVIKSTVNKVRTYVPGYYIASGPFFSEGLITITIEVQGAGDYLPKYSGNLDIITSAAIEIAENYNRVYEINGY